MSGRGGHGGGVRGRSGMETFGNSLLKNEVVTKSVENSDFIDYGATDSVTWLYQDQSYGWGYMDGASHFLGVLAEICVQ